MQRTFLFTVTLIASLIAALSPAASTTMSAAQSLRVMTYNIHVGVGMDKKLDLQRIANVIVQEKPDLVGLQEVDRGVKRTEGKDEIVELASLTRMYYAFAHNLDYQGGQYGVAILSRFPIQNIVHRKFANTRESERRGMLQVEVNTGRRLLTFVTTHLDHQYADGRLFEAEQLMGLLADVKGPLVMVGDFNDEVSGTTYKLISGGFEDAWSRSKGAGLSYPADKPVKRIDYIFTRRRDRFRVKKAWVVNTLASDHLPVIADIELR